MDAAQSETVQALTAVIPELDVEKDPLRKQMALDDIAQSLASLGRREEALAVPASESTKLEVPHLVALAKLYSGDIAGAQRMIPEVRPAYSREDLLLAIGRELVKRKQTAQALPLIRQAEKYHDPKDLGSVYEDFAALYAKCGDRASSWRAIQKARQGAEAMDKRFGDQPTRAIYGRVIPVMIRCGFVEQALQLASKDSNDPGVAVQTLQEIGANERAIQFAQSLPPGQNVRHLQLLLTGFLNRGDIKQARRVLNLSRQQAKRGLDPQEATQTVYGWLYGYALMGDLNTAYALLNKVPELKKVPDLQFSLLISAATSPARDPKVERKRVQWLTQVLNKSRAMPAEVRGRYYVLGVARFLLSRGRKTEAMPLLEMADKSAPHLGAGESIAAYLELAQVWVKAGNSTRAHELARLAAQTSDEQNLAVVQLRLMDAGFKDEAVAIAEKRAAAPQTGDYAWRQLSMEQSGIQPASPAAWVRELKDPVLKALALCGWAGGLVKSPGGTSLSGGPLLPS